MLVICLRRSDYLGLGVFSVYYDKKSYKHEVELLILSVGLPVYAALH